MSKTVMKMPYGECSWENFLESPPWLEGLKELDGWVGGDLKWGGTWPGKEVGVPVLWSEEEKASLLPVPLGAR